MDRGSPAQRVADIEPWPVLPSRRLNPREARTAVETFERTYPSRIHASAPTAPTPPLPVNSRHQQPAIPPTQTPRTTR